MSGICCLPGLALRCVPCGWCVLPFGYVEVVNETEQDKAAVNRRIVPEWSPALTLLCTDRAEASLSSPYPGLLSLNSGPGFLIGPVVRVVPHPLCPLGPPGLVCIGDRCVVLPMH